jgi:hypothetical protein
MAAGERLWAATGNNALSVLQENPAKFANDSYRDIDYCSVAQGLRAEYLVSAGRCLGAGRTALLSLNRNFEALGGTLKSPSGRCSRTANLSIVLLFSLTICFDLHYLYGDLSKHSRSWEYRGGANGRSTYDALRSAASSLLHHRAKWIAAGELFTMVLKKRMENICAYGREHRSTRVSYAGAAHA